MDLSQTLATINAVLWNETWILIIAGTGVLFTIWSGFSQYRALTHGSRVVRGVYDDPDDPGAINHFQALSAALSGTVGLGNIGGVALAITLGGPGAIFWMWVVGFLGMSIKLTEVTLSMLYRNTDDPDNPHGGPMWVADKALKRINPKYAWLGSTLGRRITPRTSTRYPAGPRDRPRSGGRSAPNDSSAATPSGAHPRGRLPK